jgi:AbiTii
MLLDEIVEFATDNQKSISVLLRKCLILAHRLGNDRLANWATSELNGYAAEQGLPDYRAIQAGALGHLSGPFGSGVRNMPIAAAFLKDQHRHFATEVQLRQPISAYEDMVKEPVSSFVIKWPADLVLFYQNIIVTENGCHLVDAWQHIGKSALVQVIDAVRNRTLAMALDLQHTVGFRDEELVNAKGNDAERIEQSVVNNIYGGTNVVSFGESQVTATVTQGQTFRITQGDTKALHRALRNSGLSQHELDALAVAMEEDGKQHIGDRVRSWIGAAASKVLSSGVQVGSQVGAAILTEWLKRYYGLT